MPFFLLQGWRHHVRLGHCAQGLASATLPQQAQGHGKGHCKPVIKTLHSHWRLRKKCLHLQQKVFGLGTGNSPICHGQLHTGTDGAERESCPCPARFRDNGLPSLPSPLLGQTDTRHLLKLLPALFAAISVKFAHLCIK